MKHLQKPLAAMTLAAMISTGVFAMVLPTEFDDFSDAELDQMLFDLENKPIYEEEPYEIDEFASMSDAQLDAMLAELDNEPVSEAPEDLYEDDGEFGDMSDEELEALLMDLEKPIMEAVAEEASNDFDELSDDDLEALLMDLENEETTEAINDESFDDFAEELETPVYETVEAVTTEPAQLEEEFNVPVTPKLKPQPRKKYDPSRMWNQIKIWNQVKAESKRNKDFDNFFHNAAYRK